nr:hypothetical protein [Tanacetum cinerariifolium]
MKSKHSRDDYLHCTDHTTKLVREQWVDTIDHDGKWVEVEEDEDSNEVQAICFYPRIEPAEPLELLEVLRNHKGAIAWSIANIKGINSSFCTYKILKEDEFKLSIQPQRRVNPNIKEVVSKEVIKLLETGLIYPFSDSPWKKSATSWKRKESSSAIKSQDRGLRAVLGNRIDKHFNPIHYASKTMNESQDNDITTKKELLVVIFSFDKFRQCLVLSKTIVSQTTLPYADHLSRLENSDLGKQTKAEIRDLFPEERLMAVSDNNEPWYADYANYLASRVLDRNYSSTEQVNLIQQLLTCCLITRTKVDIGEIIYSDLTTKLLNKSRHKYVSYPRFIACALQVLLGYDYTQDVKFRLPGILKGLSVSTSFCWKEKEKGSKQFHSLSLGIIPDPQDPERNIQVASTGFPSTLNEGTRKSQPFPKGTTTDPKDSGGNVQPADKGFPSTASNEGTAKTILRLEGTLGDKDSEGNKPPADIEPINPTVVDLSRIGAKYQVDET